MFVLSIEDFLRDQPFFGDLPADVIRGLADHSDYRRLEAGAVLFSEGDPGRHLFWLLDGEVTISAHGSETSPRTDPRRPRASSTPCISASCSARWR